jgi:hypothetical protein
MKQISFIISFLFIANIASASIVGSNWSHQASKMFTGQKLICSSNPQDNAPNKPVNYGRPFLRFDKWQKGWFSIVVHGGCSSGTLQNHSYLFRQMGSIVFDQTGMKVGTITDQSIQLTNVTDVSQRVQIQSLSFSIQADGTAISDIIFHDPADHAAFEFQGLFASSVPKKN